MPEICQRYPFLAKQALKIWEKERKPILDIFEQEKFSAVCSPCKGRCCRGKVHGTLLHDELFLFICMAEIGKNFTYPEPSWKDLGQTCLFLSTKGCLLKEFRPRLCLRHVCSEIEKVMSEKEYKKILDCLGSPELMNFRRCIMTETPLRFLWMTSRDHSPDIITSLLATDFFWKSNDKTWKECFEKTKEKIALEI